MLKVGARIFLRGRHIGTENITKIYQNNTENKRDRGNEVQTSRRSSSRYPSPTCTCVIIIFNLCETQTWCVNASISNEKSQESHYIVFF